MFAAVSVGDDLRDDRLLLDIEGGNGGRIRPDVVVACCCLLSLTACCLSAACGISGLMLFAAVADDDDNCDFLSAP